MVEELGQLTAAFPLLLVARLLAAVLVDKLDQEINQDVQFQNFVERWKACRST